MLLVIVTPITFTYISAVNDAIIAYIAPIIDLYKKIEGVRVQAPSIFYFDVTKLNDLHGFYRSN